MCILSIVMLFIVSLFFFKQKTTYEMRISDWISDVCSSDLFGERALTIGRRKLSAGFNYQRTSYDRFEGQNLDDGSIKFYLRHRSEERRVGKECVGTGQSRWSRYH